MSGEIYQLAPAAHYTSKGTKYSCSMIFRTRKFVQFVEKATTRSTYARPLFARIPKRKTKAAGGDDHALSWMSNYVRPADKQEL